MTNTTFGPFVMIRRASVNYRLPLPLISTSISAGFPSPALDFIELSIDLNRDLIKHPHATYYGRVRGDSMQGAGISDGDLLVIDKSMAPLHGRIAVCFLDGEFTLKRIKLENGQCWLMPANEKYKPIKVGPESELRVWGIVTHVIKSF